MTLFAKSLVRNGGNTLRAALVAAMALSACAAPKDPGVDGAGDTDQAKADRDGDGVLNEQDAFPDDATESSDLDHDGIGDNTDSDRDGDSVANEEDAFPDDATESSDLDDDGIGDNTDSDRDGDAVLNDVDIFPDDPTEDTDTDGDDLGNNADQDDDGDGVDDVSDVFPLDGSETLDSDDDGIGDNSDLDRDGDEVFNDVDAFPDDPTEDTDTDGDELGNNVDLDDDGDGVDDTADAFPLDATETLDTDDDGIGDSSDPTYTVTAARIAALASQDLLIATSLNLEVTQALVWSSPYTLTLESEGDISLVAEIIATTGQLVLQSAGTITATAAVSVDTFMLQGGQWLQSGNPLPPFAAADFRIAGGSFLRVRGGTGTDAVGAYRIVDIYGLQGVDTYLTSFFALANDVDAAVTVTWNDGAGFKPIGSDITRYSGDFNGAGFVVSNLAIYRPRAHNVGLFSALAENHTISQLGLEGGSIDAHALQDGVNNGFGYATGSIVGINYGTLAHCHASAAVTGYELVGGLVGLNHGTVDYGRSSGAVKGWSVATGDISFANISGNGLGGLVGQNTGTVTHSYASGTVEGGSQLGGLVGKNYNLVSNSGSTTAVSGNSIIGGLVGDNTADGANGMVEYSYAAGVLSASTGQPRGIAGRSVIVDIGQSASRSVKFSRWDTTITGAGSGCGWAGGSTGYQNCVNYVNDQHTTAWPRSTAQMTDLASFADWDISGAAANDATWYIAAGVSRPQLRLFAAIDSDGDGVDNLQDPFPFDPAEEADSDGDGVGDNADELPQDPFDYADTDQDGIGNFTDPDIDGDGVANASDAFANNPAEWADADEDGHGDNADAFDADPTEWADTNSDGVGDNGQRLVMTIIEVGGGQCPYGGTITRSGLDTGTPRNYVLDASEVDESLTTVVCNPPRLTVSGTVTGLPTGDRLTISNGVGGSQTLEGSEDQDGTFQVVLLYEFSTLAQGEEYSIRVAGQPGTRFCEPVSGSVVSGPVTPATVGVSFACHKHRKVQNFAGSGTPSSEILVGGGWFPGGYADGAGLTEAMFQDPYGVAVDTKGYVYVADTFNDAIRKISPAGVVSTLVDKWSFQLNDPYALAVDKNGIVYVADTSNNRIRKVALDNSITDFVTTCGGGSALNGPKGVAVDASGTVYVADTGNHRICKITPAGVASVFAGSGTFGDPIDAVGTAARFWSPEGLGVDAGGTVYVADSGNTAIRKINQAAAVSTVAGSTYGYLDGTGTGARFALPRGIAVAPDGTLYVADAGNRRIRKVTPAGVVSTVAGSSTNGWVDGVGTEARFSYPSWVALDGQNNLYVVDQGNRRVRKIYQSADGGTGTPPVPITDNGLTAQQIADAFNDPGGGFMSASFLLSLLKNGWNSTAYGPIPPDGVLFDFALTQCKFADNCVTAGDAMLLTINLVQSDDAYFSVIAAWNEVRSSVGWGGTSMNAALPAPSCTGSIEAHNLVCAATSPFPFIQINAGGSRIPNDIKQDMWKRIAAADRLIFTARLLRGLLSKLQPGEPGHGTSLTTALKELRDQNKVITRGLMGVLLLSEVANLIETTSTGGTLTAAQQTLSNALVSQTLTQQRAALENLEANYAAYDAFLRPPGYAGLNWLGATPTDDMKNTLATLLPTTFNSPAANETALVSMRLLSAIGQAIESEAGFGGNSDLMTALNVVAVPLGTVIGGSVGVITASLLSTTAVKAIVKVVVPFAIRAGSAVASGVSLIAGPVLLIASALALLIQGALYVADIAAFLDSMTLVGVFLDLNLANPPSLHVLSLMDLGIRVCASDDETAGCRAVLHVGGGEQLQWAVINLITN